MLPGWSSTAASHCRTAIPETKKKLADTFGLTETVGKFGSAKEAQAFNVAIKGRLDKCSDKQLGSHVTQVATESIKDGAITVWYIRVELENTSIYYRMAAIRRGANVAQMSFNPDGDADISNSDFVTLAKRAAYRLDYL